MNQYNALLIGCGNIGALYDYNSHDVLSHAKGYVLNAAFKLSVYDADSSLSEKIAAKYNVEIVTEISSVDFSDYDCISICTPTHTHYSFLKRALQANTKVIICEKPISYTLYEINDLIQIYEKSTSKVIVNYIRRFQPLYDDLRLQIKKIIKQTDLSSILIKYQKGFINNGSHAFDTLEFILGQKINLNKIQKSHVIFDFFEQDPTISVQAVWNDVPLNMVGLTNISYPVFEIELFFSKSKISITESGQKITINNSLNESFSLPLAGRESLEKEDCLKNYMVPVIDLANQYLMNKITEDNFLQSIFLNKKMLEILLD